MALPTLEALSKEATKENGRGVVDRSTFYPLFQNFSIGLSTQRKLVPLSHTKRLERGGLADY
jgi:hypothetical protein